MQYNSIWFAQELNSEWDLSLEYKYIGLLYCFWILFNDFQNGMHNFFFLWETQHFICSTGVVHCLNHHSTEINTPLKNQSLSINTKMSDYWLFFLAYRIGFVRNYHINSHWY